MSEEHGVDRPRLPVVDTHLHLWDLERFHLDWLPEEGPLAGTHNLARYRAETEGSGVGRAVYMEVDVRSEERGLEARWALDLCDDPATGVVGAVIGGRPDAQRFEADIEPHLGRSGLKGVRQVLHGALPAGCSLQAAFVAGVRWLGRQGLRFDLCMRPDELADGADLASRCPDTLFVLDHCGNAPVTGSREKWTAGLLAVAGQPNVICKVSGIIAGARPGSWTPADLRPIVEECAEAFGIDRLVFGSDWPVCTSVAGAREWLVALLAIIEPWTESERRKILSENAARWYAL